MVTADTMPFTAKPLLETAAETNFGRRWLSQGLVAFISFTQTLFLCVFLRFHSTFTLPSTLGQWSQVATGMSTLTCTWIRSSHLSSSVPAHWLMGQASHRSQVPVFFPLGPLSAAGLTHLLEYMQTSGTVAVKIGSASVLREREVLLSLLEEEVEKGVWSTSWAVKKSPLQKFSNPLPQAILPV